MLGASLVVKNKNTMRKIVTFLILMMGWISNYAHDIKMGIFDIHMVKNRYQLDVKLDRMDFLECIKTNFTVINSYMTPENIKIYAEEYLLSNLSIDIDDSCVEPMVTSLSYEDDYIRISAILNYQDEHVESIQITNTCMLDIVDGQTNIMRFDLMDRVRSFRLDEKRISTVVNY